MSALVGSAVDKPYKYKTVFFSNDGSMENTKMFEGVFYGGSYYEVKFIKRREPITDDLAQFEGIMRNPEKSIIMSEYYNFVKLYYPILKIKSTANRIFISHCGEDYEMILTKKKGVVEDD